MKRRKKIKQFEGAKNRIGLSFLTGKNTSQENLLEGNVMEGRNDLALAILEEDPVIRSVDGSTLYGDKVGHG